MAIKKNELYSSLWASCDKLRGGMDASQYKDYILTLLFVKYVTDKFRGSNTLILPFQRAAALTIWLHSRAIKTSARIWIRSLPAWQKPETTICVA